MKKGKTDLMQISWQPPEPRLGLAGYWDRFVGPGATRAELWLMTLPALVAAVAAPLLGRAAELNWSLWQMLLIAVLAFDLVGGVVTNATTAAKRWYHRPGQGFRDHFGFVVVHFIHPLLVGWLFLDGDWGYTAVAYGYLLLAALLILKAPLYLQRPLALLLYLSGLLLAFYLLPAPPGLEWFLPVFYLKLLVSHLLKEAPFPPGEGEWA